MITIILSSLSIWALAYIFYGPDANRLWISIENTPSSFSFKIGQAFWLTVIVLILLALS